MWLFCIALVSYFFLHSLLASDRVKNVLYTWIPKSYYRLLYNGFALVSLVPVYAMYQNASPSEFLFVILWIKRLGMLGLLLGSVLLFLSLGQYNKAEFSGFAQLKSNGKPVHSSLLTKGLNAWVRHPLYFSMLILIWSVFWYLPKEVHLALATITTVYLYVGACLEERKLLRYFGENYAKYQKKVPMLIPLKQFRESK